MLMMMDAVESREKITTRKLAIIIRLMLQDKMGLWIYEFGLAIHPICEGENAAEFHTQYMHTQTPIHIYLLGRGLPKCTASDCDVRWHSINWTLSITLRSNVTRNSKKR